jgi:[acyl-carrier-protein] S-malonyltransferase
MSQGWEHHPVWAETLRAAETHTGYALRQVMGEGPLEDLRDQRLAPCAVLAHSVGLFRAWREAGLPLPAAAAGHSMGFYSALVAAGVVSLEQALDLISAVEDLCEAAFSQLAMGMAFVIGASELEVRQALVGHPALVLSNRNGQAQFTLSGPREELQDVLTALRGAALKVGLLPVRHPLHGFHMVGLLPAIARRMAAVAPKEPAFPLLSHVDGRLLRTGVAAWDEGLASVGLPVDWPQVVQAVKQLGSPLAECGSGSQLAGLTRWADRALQVTSLQPPPGPGMPFLGAIV